MNWRVSSIPYRSHPSSGGVAAVNVIVAGLVKLVVTSLRKKRMYLGCLKTEGAKKNGVPGDSSRDLD